MRRLWAVPVVLLVVADSCTAQWRPQESGVTARLRGLGVVNGEVAWAGGTRGTCLRTTDGGKTWLVRSVTDASGLDFRDLHAVDARTAYLLAIGPGDRSRIVKTTDGGATWAPRYTNRDPEGFLDAIAFWDAENGLALGDPVGGRFVVIMTEDGGETWKPISAGGMPRALSGEGAFAASGTCLFAWGNGHALFGTGGGKVSRVFLTADRGRTWTAHETPVMAGTPSSGIFSLAFHDANHGIAVGGDYKEPGRAGNLVALTEDGGRTWTPAKGTQPGGYRSAVAYLPGTQGRTLVAVGPDGSDVSVDGGGSWRRLGTVGFDAVGMFSPDAGWAVGEGGRIARFEGMEPRGR